MARQMGSGAQGHFVFISTYTIECAYFLNPQTLIYRLVPFTALSESFLQRKSLLKTVILLSRS